MLRLALLALPLLAACATQPPADTARLPRDAVSGAGDPARGAVFNSNVIFAEHSPATGRPAEAARAIAQMEFLAVDLPQNGNLNAPSSTLLPEMVLARREWRSALDITPDAAAQPVINALFAAGRALDAGQADAAAAALPSSLFRKGGAATVVRLATLPHLPRTAMAAQTAQQSLLQQRHGRFSL